MKILAVDTSSASGSVALVDDGRVLCEENAENVGMHGAWLAPAIERMLKGLGASLIEVDLFAIAAGPGSFTGLRVGISAVKGLAWALGKPIAGVSTLKALARNLPDSTSPICTVLDARKQEVYVAVYRHSGGSLEPVMAERAIRPVVLIDELKERGLGDVVFVGSGLNAYYNIFKEGLPNAGFAPFALWSVRASNVALLALVDSSTITTAGLLKPFYLRRSEAEINAGQG